jgi:hypothetical protein
MNITWAEVCVWLMFVAFVMAMGALGAHSGIVLTVAMWLGAISAILAVLAFWLRV